MILAKEYRDDLLELLRDEPEQTFQELGMNKSNILLDNDYIDTLWPLYQKSVQEYEEDTWVAMIQALKYTLAGSSVSQTPESNELKPNEIYACGFKLNAKGKPQLDLHPTLGILCSNPHLNLKQALVEPAHWPKPYFRLYNKSRTELLTKSYRKERLFITTDKKACCEHYNMLLQQNISACQAVINSLYTKMCVDI